MKNKRGSHVGRVLSFVIFISFFVYFYSLLGPQVIGAQDKDYLTNYLEKEIRDNVTGSVNTITMKIEDNVFEGEKKQCVLLKDLLETTETNRISIKNMDEENTTTVRMNDSDTDTKTDHVYMKRRNADNTVFKIHISEDFPELKEKYPHNPAEDIDQPISGCNLNTPELEKGTNYTIHTSTTKKAVLLGLFKELLEKYNNDYEGLREYFNFPTGSEFGFGLELQNGTIIGTPEPNIDKDVYVRRTPVEYYTEDVEREQGFLIIKVW